jgi:hypothetical protein
MKIVRLRRPKTACSLSYVGYRPKTNTVILLDMGHTKGRAHRRDRAREGNKKLEGG